MKNVTTQVFLLCLSPLIINIPQAAGQGRELLILNRGEDNILSFHLDSPGDPVTKAFEENVIASFDIITNLDSGELIWARRFPDQMLFMKTDSSSMESVNLPGSPIDLDMDFVKGKLFWADHLTGKVYQASFDGTDFVTLNNDSLTNLTSIVYFRPENTIFFADIDSIKIWSLNLDTGIRGVVMHDSIGFPVRMALDTINEKLYWSDDGLNRIERINLDGTDREIFYQGGPSELIFGLYIDQYDGVVYWTDYGENTVCKSSILSPEKEVVIEEGLNDPLAITIVPPGISQRNAGPIPPLKINVFPNPANSTVTFASPNMNFPLKEVTIFNAIGDPLILQHANQQVLQIVVTDLIPGHYSYRVKAGEQMFAGHFTIIR